MTQDKDKKLHSHAIKSAEPAREIWISVTFDVDVTAWQGDTIVTTFPGSKRISTREYLICLRPIHIQEYLTRKLCNPQPPKTHDQE